jgi:hypothetical protein
MSECCGVLACTGVHGILIVNGLQLCGLLEGEPEVEGGAKKERRPSQRWRGET